MHELGYCEALLPVVEQRATGRPVAGIGVSAGVRHKLVADVMQMAWQMTAADTPYGNATIVLDEVSMQATCRDCGHEFTTADTLADCPNCQAMGPALVGGDQFALGWIRYRDDDQDREMAGTAVSGPSADDQHDHDDRLDHGHDHRYGGG